MIERWLEDRASMISYCRYPLGRLLAAAKSPIGGSSKLDCVNPLDNSCSCYSSLNIILILNSSNALSCVKIKCFVSLSYRDFLYGFIASLLVHALGSAVSWFRDLFLAEWAAHWSALIENISTANINHFVHQVDQVRRLVCLLILLGEMLDGWVDEVLEPLLFIASYFVDEVVKEFKEFTDVLLAVVIAIGLVKQLECLNEDVEAFADHRGLHLCVTEELFQDLNRGHAEVTIAQWYEEVVLQAWEYC